MAPTLALVAATLVLVGGHAGRAGAQEPEVQEPEVQETALGQVAAVIDTRALDPALAVVAVVADPTSTPEAPVVEVVTATPADQLPDGSRVSVVAGDPGGLRQRVSVVLEGGAAVGRVEEGGASGFAETGTAEVAITEEGGVRLALGPLVESTALWVEVEVPDGRLLTTPAYPTPQLVGISDPGALSAAVVATATDPTGARPDELVSLAAVPILQVVNQAITLRTTQPPPADVNGTSAVRTRDFVRIAPTLAPGSAAPYFVVVDHLDRTITLADSSSGGLPVPVEAPQESWLLDGLDDGEVETASVTLDRAGLLQAVGLDSDAGAVLGVARVVELDDGRRVTAEGPMATLAWFDGTSTPPDTAPSTTVPTITVTTAVLPTALPVESEGSSSPDGTVVLAAAVLAALLALVALFTARRNRRLDAEADVLEAMAKVVSTTTDEPGTSTDDTRRPPRGSVRPAGDRASPDAPAGVGAAAGVGVAGARAAREREARGARRGRSRVRGIGRSGLRRGKRAGGARRLAGSHAPQGRRRGARPSRFGPRPAGCRRAGRFRAPDGGVGCRRGRLGSAEFTWGALDSA